MNVICYERHVSITFIQNTFISPLKLPLPAYDPSLLPCCLRVSHKNIPNATKSQTKTVDCI